MSKKEDLPPLLEFEITGDLLYCLTLIAQRSSKGHSGKSLTAGLPLINNKLTVDLFFRALDRVHMEGELFEKPLSEISKDFLPCIFLLSNERACYVEKITPEGFWIAQEQSKAGVFVSHEEMEKAYSGYCIFLKPIISPRQHGKTKTYRDHWLWGTLYKFRSLYYQVIIVSFLTNVFSLLIPLYSMNVYDRVVPNNSFSTLWVLSIGILVVAGFDFILRVVKGHFVDTAGKSSDIILSSKLLERILGMQLSDRTLSVGELASHVKDLEIIREFFSSVTLVSLIDIPFAILFLMLITFIGGIWFLVVAVSLIVLLLFFSWVMHHMIAQHTQESFQTSNRKSGFLVETILGIETIKAFCAEGKTQHYWENLNEKHALSYKKTNFFSSLAITFMQNISSLNYVFFVILGVYLIAQRQLTMGGLIACTILGSRVITPFSQAISLLMRLNSAILAYQSIEKIMSLRLERSTERGYFPKEDIKGHITFKNVSFKYPDQAIEALHDINFTINPKDKVAVLGKIGSGKTTLEKIMMGFYAPTSGHVLIDDIDFRQIDPADFRPNVGYLSQDVYLFSGTLLENVVFGHGYVTPHEIEKALVISGVIHFIKHHPQGVHMQVGEGGRFLSGGQRQSVGIARAILHDPELLIFDEPTTMMDQQSERWFLSKFQEYIVNKTVILVSHDPAVLSLATKILLIDDGRIRFYGSKDEFVQKIRQEEIARQETSSSTTSPTPIQ